MKCDVLVLWSIFINFSVQLDKLQSKTLLLYTNCVHVRKGESFLFSQDSYTVHVLLRRSKKLLGGCAEGIRNRLLLINTKNPNIAKKKSPLVSYPRPTCTSCIRDWQWPTSAWPTMRQPARPWKRLCFQLRSTQSS